MRTRTLQVDVRRHNLHLSIIAAENLVGFGGHVQRNILDGKLLGHATHADVATSTCSIHRNLVGSAG